MKFTVEEIEKEAECASPYPDGRDCLYFERDKILFLVSEVKQLNELLLRKNVAANTLAKEVLALEEENKRLLSQFRNIRGPHYEHGEQLSDAQSLYKIEEIVAEVLGER
jgi:hypothetical protein